MQAERTLSDLVGDIYDAALEPARFVAVFAEMARLVGVSAAGIKFQSIAGDGVVQYWSGLPETFEQAFVAEYWRDDIWTARATLGPIGQVMVSSQLVDDETLARNRLYHELCRPHGFRDALGCAVLRSAEHLVTIGCMRATGVRGLGFDEAGRMAPLAHHFGRAAQIALALNAARCDGHALADALEVLPIAALVVDRGGLVRHANRLGRQVLAANDGLATHDGRLAAADATAQRELMRVVGGKAIGRELVIARPSRLPSYGVIAAPVGRHLATGLGGGDPTRGLGQLSSAMTLLYVLDPTSEMAVGLTLVARMFGLTVAETRLLGALGDGLTPAECAAHLAVGLPTVRSHLAQLLAKTGTRRQSELTRLAARCLGLATITKKAP